MTKEKDQVRIEGFFLSFRPDQMERIRSALDFYGYGVDGDGIKEFIIDALVREKPKESDTERFVRKAREYVAQNPEKVKVTLDLGMRLLRNITNRK